MTKFVITVFAVITLVQPALSMADDKPNAAGEKPASFVPHPHTKHHVYGSPIGPAIVGHKKTCSSPAPGEEAVISKRRGTPYAVSTIHAISNGTREARLLSGATQHNHCCSVECIPALLRISNSLLV